MDREEMQAKSWNTFREKMLHGAKNDPNFSLDDFMLQRADKAFNCWREARSSERTRDFEKARELYFKASESLEQVEKLDGHPMLTELLDKLKTEYHNFVVHRDPLYRINLKYPLLEIKENPEILQTELYTRFKEIKREDMTYVLYFAEKEGLIRREKKGCSYKLFFVREKDKNEPFLKLEDDEYDIQEKLKNIKQTEKVKRGCLIILALVAIVIFCIFTGPIGIVIVAVAYLVWWIINKNRRKKQAKGDSLVENEKEEIKKT